MAKQNGGAKPAKKTTAKTTQKKPAIGKGTATQNKQTGSAKTSRNKKHPIFAMAFAKVYPAYIAKAAKKGRTKAEVDKIIQWLTGYTPILLKSHLDAGTDFETFFAKARLNPKRLLITGTVCGVRVEDVPDSTMREIRFLDKLIDELAQGKAMGKILRSV